MFLLFTLTFSYGRYLFNPTTKALEATWDLVGDSLLAFNVVRVWLSHRWLFAGLHHSLFITHARFPEFDMHIAMEVAWYLSLLPYTKDRATFVHHLLSAVMGVYGFYNNITYIGFLLLSLMIWSNIPLAIAKILHEQKSRYADLSMMVFAIAFFITRIIVFPFYYIPIVLYSVRETWLDAGLTNIYYSMNAGLLILAMMQFIWFRKIVRICFSI